MDPRTFCGSCREIPRSGRNRILNLSSNPNITTFQTWAKKTKLHTVTDYLLVRFDSFVDWYMNWLTDWIGILTSHRVHDQARHVISPDLFIEDMIICANTEFIDQSDSFRHQHGFIFQISRMLLSVKSCAHCYETFEVADWCVVERTGASAIYLDGVI